MTMTTIWVVSTCIPSQSDPCLPNVFATETEALAHLEKMMREEWDNQTPEDEEGNRLAYPGDWGDAQDALKAYLGEEWGTWELSSHTIDVPAPTTGKVVIEVSGGVAECTSQPPGVDVEIIDHDNEERDEPVNEIEADERAAAARDRGAERWLGQKPIIPIDYPVRLLMPGSAAFRAAIDPMVCQTCGLAWDNGIVTSLTPVPTAGCPFEAYHLDAERHARIAADLKAEICALPAVIRRQP